MDGTALCGTGEQGLRPPTVWTLSFTLSSVHSCTYKTSSVLVRLNLQDNFDEGARNLDNSGQPANVYWRRQMLLPLCPLLSEDSLWMVYINICPDSTQGLCSALLSFTAVWGLGEDEVKSYWSFVSHADNMSVFSGWLLGWGWSCGWGTHAAAF